MKQTVIKEFVTGPFNNEAAFKKDVMKMFEATFHGVKCFALETDNGGFPDVLVMFPDRPAWLVETKYIGKDSRLHFQKDQPAWYRRNKDLRVLILAWDAEYGRAYLIDPKVITEEKSLSIPITQDNTAEEQLTWSSQWV